MYQTSVVPCYSFQLFLAIIYGSSLGWFEMSTRSTQPLCYFTVRKQNSVNSKALELILFFTIASLFNAFFYHTAFWPKIFWFYLFHLICFLLSHIILSIKRICISQFWYTTFWRFFSLFKICKLSAICITDLSLKLF